MSDTMILRAAPIKYAEPRTLRGTLRQWRANRSTRRALSRLEPARLADIGLDPDAALAESKRPFWR